MSWRHETELEDGVPLIFWSTHTRLFATRLVRGAVITFRSCVDFNPRCNAMAYPKHLGRDWIFNELKAYNFLINTVDTQAFFGIPVLPAPVVARRNPQS